jgi:hypothetical protein
MNKIIRRHSIGSKDLEITEVRKNKYEVSIGIAVYANTDKFEVAEVFFDGLVAGWKARGIEKEQAFER